MPPKGSHLRRAERNESFRDAIEAPYADWQIVATFYSALHYVDAVLAEHGNIHPHNHTDRETWVARSMGRVAADYVHMHQRCDDARYRLIPVPLDDVRQEFVNVKTFALSRLQDRR